MIKGVIDIGTNTAHMIIADVADELIREVVYKNRFYTFLGEDGLSKISDLALERLWYALNQFKDAIESTACKSVVVLATEGLRSASNGNEIQRIIREEYDMTIHIIDGEEEADLIFEGTKQACPMDEGHQLIMDIGGGSCEFIIAESGTKVWQASYPIGISRLYHNFHQMDPISPEDLGRMSTHLDMTLSQMWHKTQADHRKLSLIGCAGTFEIFLTLDEKKDHNFKRKVIPTSELILLSDRVRTLEENERSLVPELPKERAQYIVVALELMRYMVDRLVIDSFVVSKYALKEGALVSSKYF